MRAQSCPTLCDPVYCSLLGSSVHAIFPARILEWVAISYSRGSSWPRDGAWVSCVGRQILYHCTTWDLLNGNKKAFKQHTCLNRWSSQPLCVTTEHLLANYFFTRHWFWRKLVYKAAYKFEGLNLYLLLGLWGSENYTTLPLTFRSMWFSKEDNIWNDYN